MDVNVKRKRETSWMVFVQWVFLRECGSYSWLPSAAIATNIKHQKHDSRNLASNNPGQYVKESFSCAFSFYPEGLDYLHNGCKPSIILKDLRTSNILLDKNLQSKISDFGLCKAFETESCIHDLTDPKGAFSYVDPEYYKTKKLNRESDICSFGIVLLEMITGRSAIIRDLGPAPIHIIQWVSPYFGRMDIGSIIDPRIKGSYNISSSWKAIEIAMACVHSPAIQRPKASHVYNELKECLKIELASQNIIDKM
ncbi:protein kinase family protein [Quillaja saponaria]|uniref:Protein kinase family protein n=1 Tax=Quillaja saponaria TaxID=32244 RepID=A0AAD7LRP2_QUISA|nr:protein kinase family protein [Quillaja saponaria]